MNENWKPINDYYQISDSGNVHSLRRNIILKPSYHKNGYLSVSLSSNKIVKRFYIHRLVAIAFIPNPENKPEVNHKDGNKHNNVYTNLEWATYNENAKHAYKTNLMKPVWKDKFAYEHNKSKIVLQYSKTGEYINEYGSMQEASRQIKTNVANIMSVCKGNRKHAGGFIWKYKTPINL